MGTDYAILAPLRHECTSCGGCCQGVKVRLLDQEETSRIERLAQELGVDRPHVDGLLRFEGGRCAFQGDDQLCRIHARYGLMAKPRLCRQYPLVATRAEGELRVGIDPGCYATILSWQAGPELPDSRIIASSVTLHPSQRQLEGDLMSLLDAEGLTVAGALAALTGAPPTHRGGLPEGFAPRLVARLQAMDLAALLSLPDCSPLQREALMPLAEAIASWSQEEPPDWSPLGEEMNAYAIEVVRRVVWLRLLYAIPVVLGVVLLTLCGVVAIGWMGPQTPALFGHRLAAWVRGLRAPSLWTGLTPDSQTLTWLARGGPLPTQALE